MTPHEAHTLRIEAQGKIDSILRELQKTLIENEFCITNVDVQFMSTRSDMTPNWPTSNITITI